MARALIVGCGCHGRELAAVLSGLGWHVRGTSRARSGLEAIEAAGIESAAADPNSPGTILDLCGDIAVVVWLLGSAVGDSETISAVHGPRLERLLEKLVESPVRGFAYEASGVAGRQNLDRGSEIVHGAAERWRIPVALLTEDRHEQGWAERGAAAVAELLTG